MTQDNLLSTHAGLRELAHRLRSMCDQYGHPDWTAAEFLLAIRDVAGTLDEIAAENDRLRQAMREIAYAPFGHAEATHAEVLNDITEHARKALNG